MASDPKLVQAVFLKVVDFPPAEWAARLDVECAGDPELRKCIEELLEAHGTPATILDEPLRRLIASEPDDAIDAGGHIGPYRLIEPLGEGGMGSVWVAEQEIPIKRRVALKIIKPGMASANVVGRFQQERQALALMDHANVAKILDAGMTESRGRPFFVMELIKGVSITKYCDELHLSVRERLELFLPVCRAIEHAHQKGVVHRDIKPSNVLVCMQDGKPVPKVIDFGIAKAVNHRLAVETVYTSVGVIVGSLQYMSPEQAELGALDVDTRADVYGLGVLLYELLTGSTPLDEARIRTVPFLDTLRMIREEDPPPPSTRLTKGGEALTQLAARRRTEPARLAKELRGELDWILMKCLEKDRTRRYDSAGALARDLERHLRDEPVEAAPPSPAYRVKKFVRRNRTPVIAASAVLVALVLGIVGTTAGMVWAVDEREAARRAAEQEREAKELAQRRLAQVENGADILASIFWDLDPRAAEKEGKTLNVILGTRLDQATARLDADSVGDPLAVARLQHALGSSHVGLGYPKKAVVLLERARRTREQFLGVRDRDTLATAHALASAFRDVGRLKEAVALLEDTLRLRREVLTETHPHTLSTMNNLAVVYREVGRLHDALRTCKEVHRLTMKVHSPTHVDTLTATDNLASAHRDAGRLTDAIRMFEDTLQQRKKQLPAKHPDVLRSMSLIACAYADANRLEEAFKLSKETLLLRREVLGLLHFETLGSMGEVAVAYRKLNHLKDATVLGEETLRLRREVLGRTHPHTLLAMNNLAVTHWAADRPGDAMELFREVLQLARENLEPNHPDTLRAMCNVASGYRDAGQLAKAIPLFEETRGLMKEVFDAGHLDALTCTANLDSAYLAAEQTEKALPLLSDLLDRAGEAEPSDLRRASLLAQVGSDLISAQRPHEAEKLLRECLAVREKWEPTAWTTFQAELLIGCCHYDRDEFAAAAKRLLRGYDGLKRQEGTLPPKGKALLPLAAERLAEVYAEWDEPEEAAKWEAVRDTYSPKATPPAMK